jgi:alkylated DNA repair dioxygenase AlkB
MDDYQNIQFVEEFRVDGINVDFYPSLLTTEQSKEWYRVFDKTRHLQRYEGKRTGVIFGDEGLVYKVTYRGKTNNRPVKSWDYLEGMREMKKYVEEITGQTYTICAVQRYPNGKVGIAPHKDKEMVAGTRICGISLGATRTISFGKGDKVFKLDLPSGSMYVMNPPTNQDFTHCIERDSSVKFPRYSLTFRDYRG